MPSLTASRLFRRAFSITQFDLANRLLELDASDLHLKAGTPPAVRVRGLLTYLEGYETLRPEDTEGFDHVWLRGPA